MRRTLAFLCAVFLFSAGTGAVAEESIGRITQMQTYANPAAYSDTSQVILVVYVAGMPTACSSSMRRVAVTSTHPMYESVRATALSALAAGRDVRAFYNTECTILVDAWDIQGFELMP